MACLGDHIIASPIEKRNPVGQTFCSVGVCTHSGVDVESNSHATEERVGVLLLNLGGPDTLDDVQPFLFNLFADPAANYLDIKGLLDLTCKTVADMMKGKTPQEIRETFHIKNDYTPEEEAEVRRRTNGHLSDI